jgi:hypothetical protein
MIKDLFGLFVTCLTLFWRYAVFLRHSTGVKVTHLHTQTRTCIPYPTLPYTHTYTTVP